MSFLLSVLVATAEATPGAPPTLSWEVHDMAALEQKAPRWPTEIERFGADDVACEVTVTVLPTGHPSRVEVTACPERFAEEAHGAMWSWRWTSTPVSVARHVTMRVKFRGLDPALDPRTRMAASGQ